MHKAIETNKKIESYRKELKILNNMMKEENCVLSCLSLCRLVNDDQPVKLAKNLTRIIPERHVNIANEITHVQNNLKNYRAQFRVHECHRIKVIFYFWATHLMFNIFNLIFL